MLYRSIEVTIQPYQISFLWQRFILGGQIVDSSRYRVAIVMARVVESGLGRKDLVVINSHLSSPSDEFWASARSGRERGREMNYHSSIDIRAACVCCYMPDCTKTFWPIWVDNALTCFTVIVILFLHDSDQRKVGFDSGDSHRSIKAMAFTYMNNCIECAGFL